MCYAFDYEQLSVCAAFIFLLQDIVISGIFSVSLLAGGAANASYSTDNRDTIDDYEDRCQNEGYTVLSAFQDVCDDLPRVRDAETASAVSYV